MLSIIIILAILSAKGVIGGGDDICARIVRESAPVFDKAISNTTKTSEDCVAEIQEIYDTSSANNWSYSQFRTQIDPAYYDCYVVKLSSQYGDLLIQIADIAGVTPQDVDAVSKSNSVIAPLDCIETEIRNFFNTVVASSRGVTEKAVQVDNLYKHRVPDSSAC